MLNKCNFFSTLVENVLKNKKTYEKNIKNTQKTEKHKNNTCTEHQRKLHLLDEKVVLSYNNEVKV